MIRILHVVGRMDRAGAETMIMNLYRELDLSKYQFDFVYFTDERCDFDDEIEALGGKIIRLPGHNPFQRFWSLLALLRHGEWGIVQSHMLFASGLHLLAAKLAAVPIRIAHSHSTSVSKLGVVRVRLYQSCMRQLLSKVPTHYVACGRAAGKYLFPKKAEVTFLPNAIDVDHFGQADGITARSDLEVTSGELLILQVGRLAPVKNHLWSIAVADKLRNKNVKFKMLFVGTGPDQEQIKQEIARLGLEKHVRMLGLREDIANLMAAADVMIMPSLHEGFPVTLVESQASGLPAVISDKISPEVDLGLGLVDFIALESNSEEWAGRILECAKKERIAYSIRKKELKRHGFSVEASAGRLVKLYGSR